MPAAVAINQNEPIVVLNGLPYLDRIAVRRSEFLGFENKVSLHRLSQHLPQLLLCVPTLDALRMSRARHEAGLPAVEDSRE